MTTNMAATSESQTDASNICEENIQPKRNKQPAPDIVSGTTKTLDGAHLDEWPTPVMASVSEEGNQSTTNDVDDSEMSDRFDNKTSSTPHADKNEAESDESPQSANTANSPTSLSMFRQFFSKPPNDNTDANKCQQVNSNEPRPSRSHRFKSE